MKRITLEELEQKQGMEVYDNLYRYLMEQIKEGRLKPVKASKTNGKKPALYREYWIIEEKKEYSHLMDELKYRLIPAISNDFYLAHPDIYEKERKWVLQLNDYLKKRKEKENVPVSMNERSFEIWGREKFLKKEQGMRILKHCNIFPEQLDYYETTEPLSYYSHTRKTPQNILILENKDTFFSMRKSMMEQSKLIFKTAVGTIVYGAGKGILRSYQDFHDCVEPYMNRPENTILYFGDLDYEGILIYEKLAELFAEGSPVIPFVRAYEAMLQKSQKREPLNTETGLKQEQRTEMETGWVKLLPESSANQNHSIGTAFFSYFDSETIGQMKQILEAGRYIPQEILNIRDFCGNK